MEIFCIGYNISIKYQQFSIHDWLNQTTCTVKPLIFACLSFCEIHKYRICKIKINAFQHLNFLFLKHQNIFIFKKVMVIYITCFYVLVYLHRNSRKGKSAKLNSSKMLEKLYSKSTKSNGSKYLWFYSMHNIHCRYIICSIL